MAKEPRVCATCGTVSDPAGGRWAAILFMVILLVFGMILALLVFGLPFGLLVGFLPSTIFALFAESRLNACRSCGAKALVPVSSPRGQELTARERAVE